MNTQSLGRRTLMTLVSILVVFSLGFAAYIWLALSWSYSSGERAGYL